MPDDVQGRPSCSPLYVHAILGLCLLHGKVELIGVPLLCFAFQVLQQAVNGNKCEQVGDRWAVESYSCSCHPPQAAHCCLHPSLFQKCTDLERLLLLVVVLSSKDVVFLLFQQSMLLSRRSATTYGNISWLLLQADPLLLLLLLMCSGTDTGAYGCALSLCVIRFRAAFKDDDMSTERC